jgi:ribose 5-phosphate isomerase A
MDLSLIAKEFIKELTNGNIVAIASFEKDIDFISILIDLLNKENKKIYFVPINAKQSKQFHSLNQDIVSLNDKEIDVALEVADQLDFYNNFIKIRTNSFIRDKMISQSALKLVVLVDSKKYVSEITSDVCVEVSTFAWQRTVIHLQSFGLAQVLYDSDSEFIKTEIGHFLVRIKLDKNITLDDFEYSVRNVPGVLESGVFLGLADVSFIYNKEKNSLDVRKRDTKSSD